MGAHLSMINSISTIQLTLYWDGCAVINDKFHQFKNRAVNYLDRIHKSTIPLYDHFSTKVNRILFTKLETKIKSHHKDSAYEMSEESTKN